MYGGHIYIPYCREIHIHSTIFLLESLMKRGSKTTNLVSDYMKITCRCSTPITNSPNLCSVQKAVVILNYRWSHQLHSPIHAGRSEDAPVGKMQGRGECALPFVILGVSLVLAIELASEIWLFWNPVLTSWL